MRSRILTGLLLLVCLGASASGCINGVAATDSTASDQLATFAADLFRQLLAAFLL